jgi:CHAT domain-containing protein
MLENIQAVLTRDEVWVTYTLYPEQPLAFVATTDSARAVKLSTSLERITKLCGEFQPDDSETESGPAAAALRAAVVDPLDLPPEARRILFVPAGPLGHVSPALLFPGRAVAACPSATVYANARAAESTRGTRILALGDVDYRAQAGRFGPLPSSGPEVRAIASGKDDRKLLGGEATEGGLRKYLRARPRWRSVHLAVHGRVDPERPLRSYLALAPSEGHDGLLSAREVLRLRFESDLVALSACQVGQGTIVAGEGMLGFVRALLFAGADRVLVSLWNADDEATRALMVRFYELWNPAEGGGLPAAEALRRAQRHVRRYQKKDWSHPYYWAGWVLWGRGD